MTITLALRANDGALLSAPVTVDVVVGPAGLPGSADDGGCGCRLVSSPRTGSSAALWTAGLASLVLVLARRRRNRAV